MVTNGYRYSTLGMNFTLLDIIVDGRSKDQANWSGFRSDPSLSGKSTANAY